VAADAGFYSAKKEAVAKAKGVKRCMHRGSAGFATVRNGRADARDVAAWSSGGMD